LITLLKKYLAGYRIISVIGLILKLLEAIIEIFIPLIIALIIDRGILNNDFSFVMHMGFLMLGLYIAGYILAVLCQYFAAKSAFGFSFNLRSSLFKHINSLPIESLIHFKSASLNVRLNVDTNNTSTAVNRFIRLGTRAPFLLIGALIMALRLHPIMALIIFVSANIISFIVFFIMKKAAKSLKEINMGLDETANEANEAISGARIIRSLNRQDDINKKFESGRLKLKRNSIKFLNISLLASPLSYLVVNLVIVAILYFGGIFVYDGTLSQGEIVALINYMLQILNALIIIAMLAVIFNRAIVSSKRINEVLNCCTQCTTHNAYLIDSSDYIALKNITMTYPNHKTPALNNISFEFPLGKTLGIIGATGSGKTTLIEILMGFYKYEGTINMPFNSLDIGYHLQKNQVLSGTIKTNVSFGRQATDEQIYQALNMAKCDFVDDLDFAVLPHGANLSGGQKQRLTLARVFLGVILNNVKLLILDDPTSNLDHNTEKLVIDSIKNIEGITKIIISSKAKNIMDSHLVLVLDKGAIAGIDTHENLIAACSIYSQIYKLSGE